MSRPLSFVHLTTFYPPYSFGGDAMYIYQLAHALGDAGHNVDIIHCIDSYHMQHPAEPELAYADHPNVKVHGLRSGYGPISPLLTQQTGRPLFKRAAIQAVLDCRPHDVLNYHNISLLGPQVLQLSSRRGEAIKIYTTHEHWLICPMHVLWKFNRRPCDRPACLRCTLLSRRPPQLWRYTGLLERAAQTVDQFLSPSRFTARMHKERGFPRPVGYLPFFVDRADSDWREPAARPQERPYFLFVGRLEPIKGVQTLVELWNRLYRSGNDMAFDLLVAGGGRFIAELRAQAAGNPAIKLLGPQSQGQLGALYTHALACVVPSLTYETCGIVTLEAFARKTPVIVSDLGSLPEIVLDSKGGIVYRNESELLAALRQMDSAPRLRAELGENGYQAFTRLWTKEAHLELYFGYLRQCAVQRFGYVPWDR